MGKRPRLPGKNHISWSGSAVISISLSTTVLIGPGFCQCLLSRTGSGRTWRLHNRPGKGRAQLINDERTEGLTGSIIRRSRVNRFNAHPATNNCTARKLIQLSRRSVPITAARKKDASWTCMQFYSQYIGLACLLPTWPRTI